MGNKRPILSAAREAAGHARLCFLFAAFVILVGSAAHARDEQVGWVSDIAGLRHFSGMRCPDIVGGFIRSKVLTADADRMAGCIYSGDNGMTAVLRQHLNGTGQAEARKFVDAYKSSGFTPVNLSGAAHSGVSFITRGWTQATQCETLWHFSGKKADFTLWLAYTLPAQETEIGPAVAAFTETLNRQN